MYNNYSRIKSCMDRAANGEELTIGFIGGSITQDCYATVHENCYAYRVFSWWQKTFPQGSFHYVNGGIGGTSSLYGVSRATTDLLMYQPDFVVVDFTVNDEATPFFQETFEGLIRKILSWPSKPAIFILNNAFYDTGINAQEYHNLVTKHYGVPYFSVKDTLCEQIKAGQLIREDVSLDGLHPNDYGHKLIANGITALLSKIKEETADTTNTTQLPPPLTDNAYEFSKRLTIRELSPKLQGFKADTREKTGHLDHFKNGWLGKKAGDKIIFNVTASCIAIQYRKTIHKPARIARLILDGDYKNPILLDSNFNEDWGDCLYLESILHHGTMCEHTIEIEVIPDNLEEATPFYLLSIIVS